MAYSNIIIIPCMIVRQWLYKMRVDIYSWVLRDSLKENLWSSYVVWLRQTSKPYQHWEPATVPLHPCSNLRTARALTKLLVWELHGGKAGGHVYNPSLHHGPTTSLQHFNLFPKHQKADSAYSCLRPWRSRITSKAPASSGCVWFETRSPHTMFSSLFAPLS
jgi:hypothetical protein